MRRPRATTVSAASTKVSGRQAATASALARAKRRAWSRGSSPLSGVSSRFAGSRSAGVMPIWDNSAKRRGEAEARTNGAAPRGAGFAGHGERDGARFSAVIAGHPVT
jgi:hypothetical protein